MEQLVLTVPQDIQNYKVTGLELYWVVPTIRVTLQDEDGRQLKAEYTGVQAANMMIFLNKADLSVQSLHKRVLNQLASDGKLPAGTVTGVPD